MRVRRHPTSCSSQSAPVWLQVLQRYQGCRGQLGPQLTATTYSCSRRMMALQAHSLLVLLHCYRELHCYMTVEPYTERGRKMGGELGGEKAAGREYGGKTIMEKTTE